VYCMQSARQSLVHLFCIAIFCSSALRCNLLKLMHMVMKCCFETTRCLGWTWNADDFFAEGYHQYCSAT
jgi:hypothetical protein